MRTTALLEHRVTSNATTSSVIPAIDAAVARYVSREIVAASELIDVLLDLRLIVAADDIVAARHD